MKNNSLSYY